MKCDLVLCDIGGVVLELESERLIHQMAQVLARPFEEVSTALYDDQCLLPLELGRISPQQYYEALAEKLRLPWSFEQFAVAWNGVLSENLPVVRILERLSQAHRLVALTNTNVLHLSYIKAQFPSLAIFRGWIASCEVGVRKPDPQIYRLAMDRYGVPAHAAVYIDDRPEMVEAGRTAGLAAVRFESGPQLEHTLRELGFAV